MDITTTFFISQIVGLVFTGLAVLMIVRASVLQRFVTELGRGKQSAPLLGLIMIALSGAVLYMHHDFKTEPGKIITLLSVAALCEGVFFLASPYQLIRRYSKTLKRNSFYYGIALAYLTLGLYFLYIGFFVNS